MAENAKHPIIINLNQFKLHVDLKNKIALTLHFNSPSRKFYLSLIALVVSQMKKRGKIIPLPMKEHLDLLALLNESIGGGAGLSERENLLPRIYRKWHLALANLEEARAEAAEVLRINPKFSLDSCAKRLPPLWINREEMNILIPCERLA